VNRGPATCDEMRRRTPAVAVRCAGLAARRSSGDAGAMLKLLGGIAICLGAATAHADPEFDMSGPRVPPVPAVQAPHGLWLELGESYAHVIAMGDRLRTQAASFAPYVALSRMFYAG